MLKLSDFLTSTEKILRHKRKIPFINLIVNILWQLIWTLGYWTRVLILITLITEDGSTEALLQILYGQYLILELYVLDLKTRVFWRKRFSYTFPWTRDSHCQNSANSLAGNSQNAPQNFSPICLPKPKSFEFLKKALSGCPLSVA